MTSDERSAPAPDPVRDLIAKWRSGKRAERLRERWHLGLSDADVAGCQLDVLLDCADELEAALAATPTAPQLAELRALATRIWQAVGDLWSGRQDEEAISTISSLIAAHRTSATPTKEAPCELCGGKGYLLDAHGERTDTCPCQAEEQMGTTELQDKLNTIAPYLEGVPNAHLRAVQIVNALAAAAPTKEQVGPEPRQLVTAWAEKYHLVGRFAVELEDLIAQLSRQTFTQREFKRLHEQLTRTEALFDAANNTILELGIKLAAAAPSEPQPQEPECRS